jgi:hypothetical protein
VPIFAFPDDAAWNDDRRAVEFGVELGEYRGRVFVPRSVFQGLIPAPTPEACIEAFHLDRARFERAVEAKIARRELTDDGNIQLSLKDLRG